jgi:hypothetical protein
MSGKQLRVLGVTVVFTGLMMAVMFITSPRGRAHDRDDEGNPPSLAQVVALDECDPVTFNAALGPDFCKNVALGAATKLTDLLQRQPLELRTRAGTSNLTQSTSRKEALLP